MAGSFTLRKKFVAGLCTVVVVSLLVLLGVRLLGKSDDQWRKYLFY